MNENQEQPDDLETLAGQAEKLINAPPEGEAPDEQEQAAAQEQAAQEAQAMAMLEQGTVKVFFYLSKWGREKVAKTLPEIREEWTDEALLRPCEASIPLVRKYMASLLVLVGTSPEAAVFAMALFPLVIGLMSAQDRHEQAIVEAKRRASLAQASDNATDSGNNSETLAAAT